MPTLIFTHVSFCIDQWTTPWVLFITGGNLFYNIVSSFIETLFCILFVQCKSAFQQHSFFANYSCTNEEQCSGLFCICELIYTRTAERLLFVLNITHWSKYVFEGFLKLYFFLNTYLKVIMIPNEMKYNKTYNYFLCMCSYIQISSSVKIPLLDL